MPFFSNSAEKQAALKEDQPIIVMSRGHSGTRVLGWVLDKIGIHMGTSLENPAADTQDLRFTERIKRLSQKHLHEAPNTQLNARDLAQFQKQLIKYKSWLGPNLQPGWGWKFPETYLISNYVHAALPKAKYIHMLRDGRDIAFKEHSTDRPKRLGKTLLKHIDALHEPAHIRAARSWEFQVKRFDSMSAPLKDNMISLRFEDLIQHPVETAERVSAFVGQELTEECRQYLSTKIDTTRISQYRTEDPKLIAEVEKAIGPTLHQFGYL